MLTAVRGCCPLSKPVLAARSHLHLQLSGDLLEPNVSSPQWLGEIRRPSFLQLQKEGPREGGREEGGCGGGIKGRDAPVSS